MGQVKNFDRCHERVWRPEVPARILGDKVVEWGLWHCAIDGNECSDPYTSECPLYKPSALLCPRCLGKGKIKNLSISEMQIGDQYVDDLACPSCDFQGTIEDVIDTMRELAEVAEERRGKALHVLVCDSRGRAYA